MPYRNMVRRISLAQLRVIVLREIERPNAKAAQPMADCRRLCWNHSWSTQIKALLLFSKTDCPHSQSFCESLPSVWLMAVGNNSCQALSLSSPVVRAEPVLAQVSVTIALVYPYDVCCQAFTQNHVKLSGS